MAIDTQGRPLSPHLHVYRPQLTSLLSITHRATGVFNAIGSIGLVCWLLSAASGAAAYEAFQACLGSTLGQLALLGWSFSLYYHMCNGVRHLIWDTGAALDIPSVNRGGLLMVGCASALTAATWLMVLTG